MITAAAGTEAAGSSNDY